MFFQVEHIILVIIRYLHTVHSRKKRESNSIHATTWYEWAELRVEFRYHSQAKYKTEAYNIRARWNSKSCCSNRQDFLSINSGTVRKILWFEEEICLWEQFIGVRWFCLWNHKSWFNCESNLASFEWDVSLLLCTKVYSVQSETNWPFPSERKADFRKPKLVHHFCVIVNNDIPYSGIDPTCFPSN